MFFTYLNAHAAACSAMTYVVELMFDAHARERMCFIYFYFIFYKLCFNLGFNAI